MADKFISHRALIDSPLENAFQLQANDNFASAFSQPTRALWVGSAGNVRVRMISTQNFSNGTYTASNSNNIVEFGGVQAGSMLPIRADMVLATGTTANGFVGGF